VADYKPDSVRIKIRCCYLSRINVTIYLMQPTHALK
jgi:hypothetical protein